VKLVIPTLLQMGWIESPPYFCAASETARYVTENYIQTPVGSQSQHKFVHHAVQGTGFASLPTKATDDGKLKYMVEVYVDDFIS